MFGEAIDDSDWRSVIDHSVHKFVLNAGGQLVREGPAADTVQKFPHLVEATVASDVQSR